MHARMKSLILFAIVVLAIGLLAGCGISVDVPWISNDNLQAVISASCANCQSELTGYAPLFIAFDGTKSTGDIASYVWDFGDGMTAEGAVVTHSYDQPGIYEATLTVMNTSGETATARTVVLVLNQDSGRAVTREGELIAVTAQAPERVRLGDRFRVIVTFQAKQDLSYATGSIGLPEEIVWVGGDGQWTWIRPRAGSTRSWQLEGEVFLTLEKGSALLVLVRAVSQSGDDEELKVWLPIAMEEGSS